MAVKQQHQAAKQQTTANVVYVDFDSDEDADTDRRDTKKTRTQVPDSRRPVLHDLSAKAENDTHMPQAAPAVPPRAAAASAAGQQHLASGSAPQQQQHVGDDTALQQQRRTAAVIGDTHKQAGHNGLNLQGQTPCMQQLCTQHTAPQIQQVIQQRQRPTIGHSVIQQAMQQLAQQQQHRHQHAASVNNQSAGRDQQQQYIPQQLPQQPPAAAPAVDYERVRQQLAAAVENGTAIDQLPPLPDWAVRQQSKQPAQLSDSVKEVLEEADEVLQRVSAFRQVL